MSKFATIGESKPEILVREDLHGINMTFTAKKVFVKGDRVEVDSDGEVDTVADPRLAIGTVKVGNKAVDTPVTVITRAQQELIVQANGAISAGDPVVYDATDSAALGSPAYAPAGAGALADGVALEDIADDATGRVAVFYSPFVTAP